MNIKKYKFCRLAIIIALSMSISISISLDNYYLPIIFVLSAAAGMYYCRKQLKTDKVMVDERDFQVHGNAARNTRFIYGWIGAIGTFVLMAASPSKESVTYLLSQYFAFNVCFVLILNAFLFKYLSKRQK
ncbi:MAG: DUF2178 domain-containing protein [Candidatus Paceibacterota bacterium]